MYVKQEMYVVDGGVFETILVQMNRSKEGAMWSLGPSSFRVMTF